jgi:hypothetical protein
MFHAGTCKEKYFTDFFPIYKCFWTPDHFAYKEILVRSSLLYFDRLSDQWYIADPRQLWLDPDPAVSEWIGIQTIVTWPVSRQLWLDPDPAVTVWIQIKTIVTWSGSRQLWLDPVCGPGIRCLWLDLDAGTLWLDPESDVREWIRIQMIVAWSGSRQLWLDPVSGPGFRHLRLDLDAGNCDWTQNQM